MEFSTIATDAVLSGANEEPVSAVQPTAPEKHDEDTSVQDAIKKYSKFAEKMANGIAINCYGVHQGFGGHDMEKIRNDENFQKLRNSALNCLTEEGYDEFNKTLKDYRSHQIKGHCSKDVLKAYDKEVKSAKERMNVYQLSHVDQLDANMTRKLMCNLMGMNGLMPAKKLNDKQIDELADKMYQAALKAGMYHGADTEEQKAAFKQHMRDKVAMMNENGAARLLRETMREYNKKGGMEKIVDELKNSSLNRNYSDQIKVDAEVQKKAETEQTKQAGKETPDQTEDKQFEQKVNNMSIDKKPEQEREKPKNDADRQLENVEKAVVDVTVAGTATKVATDTMKEAEKQTANNDPKRKVEGQTAESVSAPEVHTKPQYKADGTLDKVEKTTIQRANVQSAQSKAINPSQTMAKQKAQMQKNESKVVAQATTIKPAAPAKPVVHKPHVTMHM